MTLKYNIPSKYCSYELLYYFNDINILDFTTSILHPDLKKIIAYLYI